MTPIQDVLDKLLMDLQERKQNTPSLTTNPSQEKSKKSCPFNLCDGSGILWTKKDGLTFARNCKCVEKAMEEAKMAAALSFANIPEEFQKIKVNDFDCTLYASPKDQAIAAAARKIAKNYVLGFKAFQAQGKGLYFYSQEKGSGKTMLALALGNALIQLYGVQVRFITTPDLLSEIKKTYDKTSAIKESELIDSLKKVPVLILDDIGTEKQSGWTNEILYQILNTRMTSCLVTLFTSNVHISKLQHDMRITSRIEKMSLPVQMPEESIRSKLAQKENETLTRQLLSSPPF